jgi:hypothetical protein
MIEKMGFDPRIQRRLVLLHRQYVVGRAIAP